ncbi:UDP-glucose/GDP-mannose dehydrogenase family protein [Hydrogenibacillus sp. N12]|uniref:UDP-glucose dehydrogenase family protein n=1 Tax=Hydrogenibacillus sp. N12 TaxID=2866627 RepID=UPI001C7D3474|nr:UDP-glucose/GDP-mannose dehydrogenase family protein [Hydrogenibacillus sp. N12]QZA32875.1 UDP-glucose/GDP-mannose dehydrogenase family protein [Hydrogenibacillus sp. N12]
MRVVIVGAGYVGLTTAVLLAYIGHHVTGVDIDRRKLELLRQGKSPIHEPGVEAMLARLGDRLSFTDDLKASVTEADVVMIAVGTPEKANGEADTRSVEAAARTIAEGMASGRAYTVVVKSTVPIGTNRRVAHVIRRTLEARGTEATVWVASNPEFLREGMALYDSFYPDRIIIGAEAPEAIEVLRRLYRPLLEQTFDPPEAVPKREGYGFPPLMTTDPISAEMIKYAANAFLALKISFINEIAGLSEKVGADVIEVARGIGLDARIGPRYLAAGLGWGGSCFPKDTAALLAVGREHHYEMPIVEAARRVNELQRERVVEKLQSALKGVRGRTIAVLGLAFKPNTDDVRESPALAVIRRLIALGAHIRAHDPIAVPNAERALTEAERAEVTFVSDPYAAAEGADALLLATEWAEYRRLDLPRLRGLMRTPVFLDGRNVYAPDVARAAGLTYMGVGR